MIKLLKKLSRILPSSDKWKIVALFLMMLLAAGLEVLGIGMILIFVSIISDPDRLSDIPLLTTLIDFWEIENQRDLLIYGSASLIGVFIIKNVYLVGLEYAKNTFIFNRFQFFSSLLFKKYMYAPYTFHLSRNTAELIRNVTNESKTVASGIIASLLDIVTQGVVVIGVIGFLFIVEPFITFIVICVLGIAGGFFLKIIKQRTRQYASRSLKARADMIKELNEGLGGLKDVIIMHRQSWFIRRFKSHARHEARGDAFKNLAKRSSDRVIEVFVIASMLAITILLVLQGRDVASIVPVLTLLSAAALRLMPALSNITGSYNSLRYYNYALTPVYDDLVSLPLQEQRPSVKMTINDSISFNQVSYTYPGSSIPALKNVTFSIEKGTAVGFVGPSGAGKTTLVDILLGLLVSDSGSVTADGVDIATNLAGWQKNLGYIPQSIFLADDTIRNNIAYGLGGDEIDDEKVQRAVHMAQLEELVSSLPKGLDTIIGERGVLLSGGQRQRIGIARALYHNPEVLVMDEATSSLDNQTERYIIKAIERLKGEQTIVLIAHRLTTVQNCDMLYVVKDGNIVANGSYKELLRKNKDFQLIAHTEHD